MPTPEGDPAGRIGRNIYDARKALGWSKADLARATNLGPSTLSMIERGLIADPRVSILYRIALALGVTMEDLMGVQPLHRTTKAAVVRRRERSA